MARAARHGSVQPDVFLEMDFEDGIELARRVSKMHFEEQEQERQVQFEMVKALLKQIGEVGKLIARKPGL